MVDSVRALEDLITTRRSVRQYAETRVDTDRLVSLARLGTWAPSGGNAQTWRFVVVTEEATIRAIHAVSPGISFRPPAVIVVCQDLQLAEEKGGALGRDRCAPMDAAMAAQTIMLAAHAEGLGTCPILSFHQAAVQSILALPQQVVPELLLTVGHPRRVPAPPPRVSDGVIHLDRWEDPNAGGPDGVSDRRGTSGDHSGGDA